MLFDLHLHSRYSIDALSKPSTIVKICKKNSWGFSLTDHNNMNAYTKGKIKELAKKAKVLLIPGEEIKVVENGKVKGEIIAYFLKKEIEPTSFAEILDEAKKQDALLSCPHPFEWSRKNYKDFPKNHKKFVSMEIYNARAYYRKLNLKAFDYYEENLKNSIAPLGVSDAHTPEEIGNGLTKIEATTLEEVRKELKKGNTKAIPRAKAGFSRHLQTQLARRHWMDPR
ncbi:MAG: PHP domain-containing protein [Candidatus Diapherotrites archaeon]|jgi:predicted metal-dependent phosphoesterase TrpH|uniref:PHP domain-containing protein n=1 Tax=Candidatus Iainarchaeum sp. TaxID=3101447 RepID=A0A8T5GG49_9ARCH|nr:PHP domain-containing protein [Candidatus Diapherotrites archaeon]MBT7241479.1 PHP domain-containing protein [Candidatus Diapherotrites archaeon]